MEIVYDDATLRSYMSRATEVSPGHPVLIDKFFDDAIEVDVDALYDGDELYLGGSAQAESPEWMPASSMCSMTPPR